MHAKYHYDLTLTNRNISCITPTSTCGFLCVYFVSILVCKNEFDVVFYFLLSVPYQKKDTWYNSIIQNLVHLALNASKLWQHLTYINYSTIAAARNAIATAVAPGSCMPLIASGLT